MQRSEEPLIVDVDYTIENGLLVFTALYLQKQGHCCRSGCRNCPYGFRREECATNRDPDERTGS